MFAEVKYKTHRPCCVYRRTTDNKLDAVFAEIQSNTIRKLYKYVKVRLITNRMLYMLKYG